MGMQIFPALPPTHAALMAESVLCQRGLVVIGGRKRNWLPNHHHQPPGSKPRWQPENNKQVSSWARQVKVISAPDYELLETGFHLTSLCDESLTWHECWHRSNSCQHLDCLFRSQCSFNVCVSFSFSSLGRHFDPWLGGIEPMTSVSILLHQMNYRDINALNAFTCAYMSLWQLLHSPGSVKEKTNKVPQTELYTNFSKSTFCVTTTEGSGGNSIIYRAQKSTTFCQSCSLYILNQYLHN